MKYKLLFILPVLFLLNSCQSDYAYGPGGTIGVECDTTDITYNEHIKPIIEGECKSCHNSTNLSGGVNLESYSAVKDAVQNDGVQEAVNYSGSKAKMPPGGKMDACRLAQIESWIKEGLKE